MAYPESNQLKEKIMELKKNTHYIVTVIDDDEVKVSKHTLTSEDPEFLSDDNDIVDFEEYVGDRQSDDLAEVQQSLNQAVVLSETQMIILKETLL